MVERHDGAMGGVIQAVVAETGATGYAALRDIVLHASMANNRRPGKVAYSPRSFGFGVDEKTGCFWLAALSRRTRRL